MSKLRALRYYWSPIAFFICSIFTVIYSFSQRNSVFELFPFLPVTEKVNHIAGLLLAPIDFILILGTMTWMLFLVFLGWFTGVLNLIFGLSQYYYFSNRLGLHYCWSSCLIGIIYSLSWLMMHFGYMPHE
jgi:hypothetical protein